MTDIILKVTPKNDQVTYTNFLETLHAANVFENFDVSQIVSPAYSFRSEFLEHIAKDGFSSLYNFQLIQEDITSSSMSVNEIEQVIEKFISKLNGAKRLVIIDPYFFAKSSKIDVVALFKRLMVHLSSELEEIYFITNGRVQDIKSAIFAALDQKITAHHFVTEEFHDRYWIDPDNSVGIVMGTSLNGLGNKVALIDSLKDEDVAEIVTLVKNYGCSI